MKSRSVPLCPAVGIAAFLSSVVVERVSPYPDSESRLRIEAPSRILGRLCGF